MKTFWSQLIFSFALVQAVAAAPPPRVPFESQGGSEEMGRLFDGIHTPYPGQGFALGSFDADPSPDLIFGLGNQLILWTVTPEGGFAQDGTIATSVPLEPVGVGRMNGDSYPDLVARTSTSIGILAGGAAGLDANPTFVPAPGDGIAISDVDGNGLDDFTAVQSDSVVVLLNNGAGFVRVASHIETAEHGIPAFADFDGDGDLDAVVSGLRHDPSAPHGVIPLLEILRNEGGGHLLPWTEHTVDAFVENLWAGDLDGDGLADIATNGARVSIFWNGGNGHFVERLDLAFEEGFPAGFAAGDIDGNGTVDLVTTASYSGRSWARIHLNHGSRNIQLASACYSAGAGSADASGVGDFDGDGTNDVLVPQSAGEPYAYVALFRGRVHNLPSQQAYHLGVPGFYQAWPVNFESLGRDAVLLVSPDSAVYMRSNSDGTLQAPLPLSEAAGFEPRDITGDDQQDLVQSRNGEIVFRRGLGALVFAAPETLRFGNLRCTADFNGDDILDLLVGDASGLRVLPGLGEGAFGSPGTIHVPAHGEFSLVAAADLDGDGFADLATTEPDTDDPDSGSHSFVTYRNDGTGHFKLWQDVQRGPVGEYGDFYPYELGFMNLDGDTEPDVYIGYYDEGEVLHVARGVGNGQFAFVDTVWALLGESNTATFADLDRDGLDEVIVTSWSSIWEGYVMIWQNDDGHYPDLEFLINAGGRLTATAIGDFDGNGALDLVQACHESGGGVSCEHVTLHLNRLADAPTPVLASLVSQVVTSNQVRIEWYAADADGPIAVERREGANSWVRVASLWSDRGRLVFEDHDVVSGRTYEYRLALSSHGEVTYTPPVSIRIPIPALTLRAMSGKDPGHLALAISTSTLDPVEIAVHDLQGRRVASARFLPRAVGEDAEVELRGVMRAGVYWAIAHQGEAKASTRIVCLF